MYGLLFLAFNINIVAIRRAGIKEHGA